MKPLFPAPPLEAAGLNRHVVFDIDTLPPEIGKTLDAPGQQLILIGHAGRQLWTSVKAVGMTGSDLIDDFTVQTVQSWFAEQLPGHSYQILYPGNCLIGLQALGKLAGWHRDSLFMLGIDPFWGSWQAYRALVVADTNFSAILPVDRQQASPCATCPDAPCIQHCPAGALSRSGEFALRLCLDYRRQPESACRYTCLARLACPVGREHRYDADQLRHTYAQSLKMIGA